MQQQSPKKASSKDLQRAPKPLVDKERALKFWEESESSRASGNANFYKTLRSNRTSIIVVLIAIALIYFRLQEATCVQPCFNVSALSYPTPSLHNEQIQR